MKLKDLTRQDRALIVAGILCIILLGGIIFLGNEFRNIDDKGLKCLKQPLLFAENRMQELNDVPFDCTCQRESSYAGWGYGD